VGTEKVKVKGEIFLLVHCGRFTPDPPHLIKQGFFFFSFRELFLSCSFVTKKMGPTIWDLHRKGDQWQQ